MMIYKCGNCGKSSIHVGYVSKDRLAAAEKERDKLRELVRAYFILKDKGSYVGEYDPELKMFTKHYDNYRNAEAALREAVKEG